MKARSIDDPDTIQNGRQFRGQSGLESYDRALWLQPPPKTKYTTALPSGTGFLLQTEQSANGLAQEVIVNKVDTQAIMLLVDCAKDIEWHVDGDVKQCAAQLSVATMSRADRTRWVIPRSIGHVLHLHFAPKTLAGLLPELNAPSLSDEFYEPDAILGHLARALHMEMQSGVAPCAIALESYATLIARSVLLGGKRPPEARGGLAGWQIRRACEAMDAHLDGDIGLVGLAGIVGLSPAHFSRAFKQSMGMPPSQWLLNRRVEKAKELLSDGTLGLAEIAQAVGFAAQPQFTTAFRRATGMTPGAWRRVYR